MEITSTNDQTLKSLDELFKELGECDYLYIKTNEYLEGLENRRKQILNAIDEIHNGKNNNSEDMGTTS